jgi:hypothetical protein
MEKTMELNFIDGEFSSHETKELLMDLFTKKIKFHEMKKFSTLVRYGEEDEFSNDRISDLRSTIEKLNEFINELDDKKVRLVIKSKIEVVLKDE